MIESTPCNFFTLNKFDMQQSNMSQNFLTGTPPLAGGAFAHGEGISITGICMRASRPFGGAPTPEGRPVPKRPLPGPPAPR